MSKKSYEVLHPINSSGTRFGRGDVIDLDDEQAASLERVIRELPERASKSKSKPKSNSSRKQANLESDAESESEDSNEE